MPYLRSIVGRHGRRVHRQRCNTCVAPLYRFERHCPTCGAANSRFDAAIFLRFARCTLDEAAATCRLFPDHVIEGGRTTRSGE
jgi:predicted amidophosphoribosyltransferase